MIGKDADATDRRESADQGGGGNHDRLAALKCRGQNAVGAASADKSGKPDGNKNDRQHIEQVLDDEPKRFIRHPWGNYGARRQHQDHDDPTRLRTQCLPPILGNDC